MKTVLTCHHCPIVKGHGHTYLCFIDEMQSVNSVLKAPVVLEGVPGGPQLNNGELVSKWTLLDLQLFSV